LREFDKMVASGIDPDRVLHSTMNKAMAKFAEHFHGRLGVYSFADVQFSGSTLTPLDISAAISTLLFSGGPRSGPSAATGC
jgi:hypothetical protein